VIKIINFLIRKPGLSVQEFQTYWRSTHSNFFRLIPGVKRYVQSHTILSGYRREPPPPADGIEEIYFERINHIQFLESAPAHKALRDDLDKFVDFNKFRYIIAEEMVIKPGNLSPEMVKNIEFLRRKPGMPIIQFHRYWQKVHGPLAAKIRVMQRYVQSHTLMSEYQKETPPAYDGVAETWFVDTSAMRESARSAEYAATRADENNFTSGEREFVITRELQII